MIDQGCAELYLDLMKRCLTNMIYPESEYTDFMPGNKVKQFLFKKLFMPLLGKMNAKFIRGYNYNEGMRISGSDWPPMAHTMIWIKGLDNLQHCVVEAIKNNIPGDLIETGVWRGGASIFMRAILKAYGVVDRKVWVADSFEGLPKPDEISYPQDRGDKLYLEEFLAVPLEQVKGNFQKYGLLDNQVIFLKGWFKDTLPSAPIQKIAVARLDGDMYQSTMDALNSLYHRISSGGFIIIDDYGIKGVKQAVHDFRKEHAISDEMSAVEGTRVYWKKS